MIYHEQLHLQHKAHMSSEREAGPGAELNRHRTSQMFELRTGRHALQLKVERLN
jgi:hypothetical protein